MIRLTSEYALRALIYLAQHSEDWPIPGNEIAKKAGVPAKYLSTVLSALVRNGVLEATRGKCGGFRLVQSARETRLFDVLAPFEPDEVRRCPFGNEQCNDDDPCLAHEKWKKITNSYERFLKETSIFDIAVKRRQRRRAAGKRRKR